ncbi:hypothetical protein Ocin01_07111 [Orchesella cincta]|uniref:Uncharacterized protein n=1 Tax=Orchesella cincta TaxID=48709 RepID=A0A1D2N2X2_ORCCI|nr:hypothetical protein Ocin01_07111 [Orchesella cincta]
MLRQCFTLILYIRGADARESHLLPARWSSDQNRGRNGNSGFNNYIRRRRGRTLLEEQSTSHREEKQTFRLELLRQIKAIDHMKCFPKVLCGLSVESDKSFGINKSNFVRSYLELMRNVKAPQAGADERERTEDEVEGELTWPFSPHNPERKDHSSFERISSAAMSASVEVPDQDSMEYLRGLDSRARDDPSSISEEKHVNRRIGSVESKEKLSSATITKMDSSKIPGEKKKKKNSNKSLTSKLTSYFTSWLPEIVSFSKDRAGASETDLDREDAKRAKRSMNDDSNSPVSADGLENIPPELRSLIERSRQLRDESETGAVDGVSSDGNEAARDDFKIDSAEHDADIYHTAVNIGKRLKDSKQCDYIYNGCPLEYNSILQMINSIKTEISPEDEEPAVDTAEAVSQELGLDVTPSTPATTTTTAEPTTKRPQRKKSKPRPSTKIMHVLPNGEKVEINFRLGGSEDSEESSSSAQRDLEMREHSDESSSERDSSKDEVVVVDLGQRPGDLSNDKKMSNRRGAPPGMMVVRKSNKNKISYLSNKSNLAAEHRNEDEESPLSRTGLFKHNPTIKLNGMSLSTNDDEQPLEISPSYVIIKHQPLSVHTTSVLSPDNLQSQGNLPHDNLQAFQLIQNGQKLDNDQLADQIKKYIRQHGGLIPKLSLQSSGLITSDAAESASNSQKLYSMQHSSDSMSTSQKMNDAFSNPMADLSFEPVNHQSSNIPFSSHFPQSAHSSFSLNRNSPQMVGSVPGRLDSLISPKTTTTTTTTSTTTEKIILPGMAETLTYDTEEITDDAMIKLSSHNSILPDPTSDTKEKDNEMSLLENLNKSLLSENGASGSKIRYKNPKKKRTRVKANTSRVRASVKRNKNKSSSSEESGERVVIKHAGPYNSSPTMYQSPLQGPPGSHGGAYPYLHSSPMQPSVFPGYPFWRL